MAAELTQFERALAIEIGRDIETASEQDIAADTATRSATERQRLPRSHVDRCSAFDGKFIQPRTEIGTCDTQANGCVEKKGWPRNGNFQARRPLGIAEQAVAGTKGTVIHGSGRRNANGPQALTAWPILYRRCCAPADHTNAARMIADGIEQACGDISTHKLLGTNDVAQPAQIGLDAVDPAVIKRGLHCRCRGVAGGGMYDQLGEHRVVPCTDRASRHAPCFGTNVRWKHDGRQCARCGAIVERRIFGIDAHLHGMAARLWRLGIQKCEVFGSASDHPLDKVDAHHFFGNAMFDLESGVHFQKEELLPFRIEEEFYGASG